jgi:hypothetical protein
MHDDRVDGRVEERMDAGLAKDVKTQCLSPAVPVSWREQQEAAAQESEPAVDN